MTPKLARRRAREAALQALYAWQLAGGEAGDIVKQALALEGCERADQELAEALIRGVIAGAPQLEEIIAACIDRKFSLVSPVERAILYIGARELAAHAETPFKVILNEAIELGKAYGGNEGHKFVNGVLEKLAIRLRPQEVAQSARARRLEAAHKTL